MIASLVMAVLAVSGNCSGFIGCVMVVDIVVATVVVVVVGMVATMIAMIEVATVILLLRIIVIMGVVSRMLESPKAYILESVLRSQA